MQTEPAIIQRNRTKRNHSMSTAIKGLKPESVWRYFAEISRIPRCSKNEAAVTRYVLDSAARLDLPVRTDLSGNVVVKKPASPGRSRTTPVVLQGHLDMVGEKNRDTAHDFLKDPIQLLRKGDVITADGTTLGADNGIAVAVNLAIMEDRTLEHGPLEFLFTVDEETGLNGAGGLSPGFFESRVLVNLDSEEDGVVYIGCSGGRDTAGTFHVHYDDAPSGHPAARVKVTGLKGGHSGLEIDKDSGNAIKIMNRVLGDLADIGVRVSSIEGGDKHNAIPRECEAVVVCSSVTCLQAETIVAATASSIKEEFVASEPDLMISFTPIPGENRLSILQKKDQAGILRVLSALPHGVIRLNPEMAGLVETSTNLACIRTRDNTITISTSQRSSTASQLKEISTAVSSVFLLGGATVDYFDAYPGWKPNPASPILGIARNAYHALFGIFPDVRAIHAGLECGVIGERIPGMDMISIGPTIEGAHSPDERLHIDTVEKFWNFLLELLKKIP
jgi:dipeptidase D